MNPQTGVTEKTAGAEPAAVSPSLESLRKRADFLAAAKGLRKGTTGFHLQARDRGEDGPIRFGITCSRKVGNGRAAENPYEMIRIGKKIAEKNGWEQEEERLVKNGVIHKFNQHPELLEKLKKVDGHIYEATRNKRWGCGRVIAQATSIKYGDNPGDNKLGVFLETVRDTALANQDILTLLVP